MRVWHGRELGTARGQTQADVATKRGVVNSEKEGGELRARCGMQTSYTASAVNIKENGERVLRPQSPINVSLTVPCSSHSVELK